MGFELSDEGTSSYTFSNVPSRGTASSDSSQSQAAPSSKKPTSIYRLVSKKCSKEEKPEVKKSTSSLKKVQFEEHNTSTESDNSNSHEEQQFTETDTDAMEETEDDMEPHSEETHSETQESFDDTFDSGSESSIPESYRSPSKRNIQRSAEAGFQPQRHSTEEDDISMSAFVPDSVRRQSVLPSHPSHSDSSEDGSAVAGSRQDYSSGEDQTKKHLRLDDTESEEDEEGNKEEMDDLLDEALDDLSEVEMRKDPKPQPVSSMVVVH